MVYTVRGSAVRIISARKANWKEVADYEHSAAILAPAIAAGVARSSKTVPDDLPVHGAAPSGSSRHPHHAMRRAFRRRVRRSRYTIPQASQAGRMERSIEAREPRNIARPAPAAVGEAGR